MNTHLGCRAASVPLITTGDTPASWSQLYFSNTCTVSAQRPTSVLWDRNSKQGSFAGKILWKPTQVCLLWYFHATDLARGGVKLVSRVTIHSKSLVAHFWVKSSPYLEIIDAFLLKKLSASKLWQQFLTFFLAKSVRHHTPKHWLLIFVVIISLFCIPV